MLGVLEVASRAEIEAIEDSAVAEFAHRAVDQTTFCVTCPSLVNRYFVIPPQRIEETQREEKDGRVDTTSEIPTPDGGLTIVTGRNHITNTTWTIIESRIIPYIVQDRVQSV